MKEFKSTINNLIKDEFSPKNAQSNSSLVLHLDFPQKIEGNNNYYGNQFIDVIGRDAELERLNEFLDCKQPFAWFQIAGVAGQGKSRLAFELIKKAKSLDWEAGLLESIEIDRMKDHWWQWQPDKPHLIVIDYVISRIDTVRPFFKILSRRRDEFQHPVRLLLLERQRWDQTTLNLPNAEVGIFSSHYRFSEKYAGWFLRLTESYDGKDSDINESRFDNGVLELTKLDSSALPKIAQEVVNKLEGAEVGLSHEGITQYLDHIDKESRPLYAYFLAHEIANKTDVKGWAISDFLDSELSRDRHYWWKKAFGENTPSYGSSRDSYRLALMATITEGFDCDEAHRKGLIEPVDPETRKEALVLARGFLPDDIEGPDNYIPPIKPHLLGEWFVIKSFEKGISANAIINACLQYSAVNVAEFLSRLDQDFSDNPSTKTILQSLSVENIDIEPLSAIAVILFTVLQKHKIHVSEKIVEALRFSAERNKNIWAVNILGECYLKGISVEKNSSEALSWYKESAKFGNAGGYAGLGLCYGMGIGADQNLLKAIEYTEQAFDAGNAEAEGYLISLKAASILLSADEGLANDESDTIWATAQADSIPNDYSGDLPLISGKWQKPAAPETQRILAEFHRTLRILNLVNEMDGCVCCHVRTLPLVFYPKHSLVDIEFYLPEARGSLVCSAIEGPHGVVPIAQDMELIRIVNKGLLDLKTDDAPLQYLQFFCGYTRGEQGAFYIIDRLGDISFLFDGFSGPPEIIKLNYAPVRQVDGEFESDGWQCYEASMVCGTGFFKVILRLSTDGEIKMVGDTMITSCPSFPSRRYGGIFRSAALPPPQYRHT